jgi:hypothetical protein
MQKATKLAYRVSSLLLHWKLTNKEGNKRE